MIDKSKDKIEAMFDQIAPTYDKLNHLFTLNIDRNWRKEIVKYLSGEKFYPRIILDLASGTGDLTSELLSFNPEKIYASDISKNMLDIQRRKIVDKRLELVQADALNLPFEENYFDLITIGFGVRNFEDLNVALKEIRRVLRPGGVLVVLEMFRSSGFTSKLFNIYFGKVMPFFGNRISNSKDAYSYLFNSVENFLSVKDFLAVCKDEGFRCDNSKNNFLGIVNTVYLSK